MITSHTSREFMFYHLSNTGSLLSKIINSTLKFQKKLPLVRIAKLHDLGFEKLLPKYG